MWPVNCMEDNSILSIYLDHAQYPIHSIIQHLPSCKHLTALYISKIEYTQDRELLAKVLPQLVQLQCVEYGNYDLPGLEQCYKDLDYHDMKYSPADTDVLRAVQHLQALRHIGLQTITLIDTVTLPPQLETVMLRGVQPAYLILPSLWHCSQLKHLELQDITLADTVKLPPQLHEIKLVWVHSIHFILQSLPSCPHITSLHIEYRIKINYCDCELLASVLPQLKHLQYIHIHHIGFSFDCEPAGHVAVVSALQHLTQLRHIKLLRIDLGDAGTLLVTPHMTQLQKVELESVKMSARRWTEFVSSLLSVQHTVHVTLEKTTIDDNTVKTIHSSKHFTVTEEERMPWDNSLCIKFHTVQ